MANGNVIANGITSGGVRVPLQVDSTGRLKTSGTFAAAQVTELGVGGANDGTQAPLYIENNSLALAESASLTSTRLIELAASVSSTQHKVLDAGFHIDCNGFNFTGDLTATYGGWFAENSTGSGTVTDARGVGAFGQVGAGGIVTHGYGLRSTLSTAATGTLTNGYGIWTGCTNSGTLTNWYGVTVGNVTAGTITVGFRSQIAAGTGKWGLYLDGGANNYLGTGYTILGTTTAPSTGILQLATATNAAGGISFGSDTNLYRSAANTLKTDDDFSVVGDLYTDGQLRFGTSGRFGKSTDGEFTTLNNANTTNASLRHRSYSQTKTGSWSVSATESGTTFNNTGAGSRVDATLPASPGAGAKYRFVVVAAVGIRIQTGTAVQIRNGASITTATTGYIQSTTIGDVIEVELVGSTWFVTRVIGAGWSVV